MTDAQVLRIVDELMDKMFGEIEREEREVERLMQEQVNTERDSSKYGANNQHHQ